MDINTPSGVNRNCSAGDLENRCKKALQEIYDPEIPINIYDLGLIYAIDIDKNGYQAPEQGPGAAVQKGAHVDISMTLTSPGCPVAGEMPGWVEEAVGGVEGVASVSVRLVWEPPWGIDSMSDEVKLELGLL